PGRLPGAAVAADGRARPARSHRAGSVRGLRAIGPRSHDRLRGARPCARAVPVLRERDARGRRAGPRRDRNAEARVAGAERGRGGRRPGRAPAPSPYFVSATLGAGVLARAGTETQKREWLPRIAAGEAIVTPAWL